MQNVFSYTGLNWWFRLLLFYISLALNVYVLTLLLSTAAENKNYICTISSFFILGILSMKEEMGLSEGFSPQRKDSFNEQLCLMVSYGYKQYHSSSKLWFRWFIKRVSREMIIIMLSLTLNRNNLTNLNILTFNNSDQTFMYSRAIRKNWRVDEWIKKNIYRRLKKLMYNLGLISRSTLLLLVSRYF